MEQAGSIFVLGSFMADVALQVPRLPAWGETLPGSDGQVGPGGKGSNQAIAAAKAGGRVKLLTRVGADAFGELGRHAWRDAGVDASLVQTVEVSTGIATILLQEGTGENAIAISPGACATMSPADVFACVEEIRGASVLLAQLEVPLAVVMAGLQMAREGGGLTILNPAPVPGGGVPEALLALCDVLVPNEAECLRLANGGAGASGDVPAAVATLQRRGARHVVVTLGAAGALVAEEGKPMVRVPAAEAGVCVDTTGAGDAFCGALSVALAEGKTLGEAVARGCAAGALAVTRRGAGSAMPFRAEIEAVLRNTTNAAAEV